MERLCFRVFTRGQDARPQNVVVNGVTYSVLMGIKAVQARMKLGV